MKKKVLFKNRTKLKKASKMEKNTMFSAKSSSGEALTPTASLLLLLVAPLLVTASSALLLAVALVTASVFCLSLRSCPLNCSSDFCFSTVLLPETGFYL